MEKKNYGILYYHLQALAMETYFIPEDVRDTEDRPTYILILAYHILAIKLIVQLCVTFPV